MDKCPICGSEIEIKDVIDFDHPREDQFEAVGYVMDLPLYIGCVRVKLGCSTCKKGLCLTFKKLMFNGDMDKMIKTAKELFIERAKEGQQWTMT